MAAVWALGGATPAWEHALRLLLLILGLSVAGGPALHARLSRGSASSDAGSQAGYTTMKSPQG
ncbi:hypothetical protein AB0D54_15120 [Streptomyces xanthophaeus]|uniref:hypothetical protein n=1 Tax=Streptomyces xanthophaeus TaxID=67385 RepID=UPI0034179E3B